MKILARNVFAIAAVVVIVTSCTGQVTTAAAPSNCNRSSGQAITYVRLPGNPFQALPTNDGCWIFVSMLQGERGARKGLEVIRRSEGRLDLVRVVDNVASPAGMALTHDGQVLIVAAGDRVKFLDVGRLTSGDGNPVLGELDQGRPVGAIEATVTSNDSLLFVSYEHGASVVVIDLFQTRKKSFIDPVVIGRVSALVPVSVVLSPDERLLYVSAMTSPPSFGWPQECHNPGADASTSARVAQGAILVFDVARAAAGRDDALVGRVPAGCSPVRVALSPGGDTAYATVRWDNQLLAFDTRLIVTDPANALLAHVPVGMEPVGVLPVNGGNTIVVANSHRFADDSRENQTLSIVDAARLGSGASAVVGTIPAGAFPRELKLTADGRTLLLTNFGSETLEVIDLTLALSHPSVDRSR
jgi:DNA-binding beta-propeller fold protein YncE